MSTEIDLELKALMDEDPDAANMTPEEYINMMVEAEMNERECWQLLELESEGKFESWYEKYEAGISPHFSQFLDCYVKDLPSDNEVSLSMTKKAMTMTISQQIQYVWSDRMIEDLRKMDGLPANLQTYVNNHTDLKARDREARYRRKATKEVNGSTAYISTIYAAARSTIALSGNE